MATTPNYILLERITVGAAGAASVTFNNIPQTGYTDLTIKFSARENSSGDYVRLGIAFNGINTGFSGILLTGNGSSASISSASNTTIAWGVDRYSATANTFSNGEIYIPNYKSSNPKSFSIDAVEENNATAALMSMSAGLWTYTGNPAITSITLLPDTRTTFAQYSDFSLYGISAVGVTPTVAPYASGGDVIETDGTYWYHAFTNSGFFKPNKPLSCDVLVVAGGGGAGSYGGGGGAGGVIAFASQSLATNSNSLAIIGAGGNSANNSLTATSGTNSQFGSLTVAIGGGVGGNYNGIVYANGANGGSGGGAPFATPSGFGTGTSGQGNNGGTGTGGGGGSNRSAGGGGGAGGVGGNGVTGTGGTGGAGVNTVTNWGSLSSALTTLGLGVSGYIAGGGGGGNENNNSSTGGTGGGGNSNGGTGAPGVPNTGSGGGGGGGSITGGIGGSGLIILRYAI